VANNNNRQRTRIFEGILNFRDLGGFLTRDGRTLAAGKVFRSGELHHATPGDLQKLMDEFRIVTILDLRSARRTAQTGHVNLEGTSFKYCNVNLELNPENREPESSVSCTHMGELYFFLIRQPEYGRQMVRAVEIISHPGNLPVLFHCNAGKDRAGMLAALLLNLLGVADEDIIIDYALSEAAMKEYLQRLDSDPLTSGFQGKKPAYQKEAAPASMSFFLAAFKAEYGSAENYLKLNGADDSIISGIKASLLA
jgi:protein-tyrosine phosphatase